MLSRQSPDRDSEPAWDPVLDAPVERIPPYKDNTAKVIRVSIIALLLIAMGAAVAYTQFQPRNVAPNQMAAMTPPIVAPTEPPAVMPAPSALPPAPMLEEKHTTAVPKPVTKTSTPKSAQSRADGPVPTPLVDPTSAAPPQTVDVDPKTPNVLTPIPDKVAPATP